MIAQSKASGLGCTLEQTPATLLPPSTTSGCPARTPRGPSRLPTDGGRRHGAEREHGGGDSPWSSSASGPCLSFFLCSSSPSLENPRFLFSNSPVLLSRKPPTISAHSVGETFLCISCNNKIGNFPSLTEKNQEAWSVLVARGHVAAPGRAQLPQAWITSSARHAARPPRAPHSFRRQLTPVPQHTLRAATLVSSGQGRVGPLGQYGLLGAITSPVALEARKPPRCVPPLHGTVTAPGPLQLCLTALLNGPSPAGASSSRSPGTQTK